MDREQLTESRSDWGRDGADSSYIAAADEAGTPPCSKGACSGQDRRYALLGKKSQQPKDVVCGRRESAR